MGEASKKKRPNPAKGIKKMIASTSETLIVLQEYLEVLTNSME